MKSIIILLAVLVTNIAFAYECNLDFDSRSKDVNWEIDGPDVLRFGPSLTRLRGGRLLFDFGDEKRVYQCMFDSDIGAFRCVYQSNRLSDAFVMIKKRNTYQIFDYYFLGESGKIIIKENITGNYICQ